MVQMTNKISSMSIQQVNIKKQNSLLMAYSRKSQIEEAVGKLNNPMSIRSVKLNFKVLHLVQDLLSVFKPDSQPLVPVNLADMGEVAAADVLIMEEITRILLRDNEVHQVLLQVLSYLVSVQLSISTSMNCFAKMFVSGDDSMVLCPFMILNLDK